MSIIKGIWNTFSWKTKCSETIVMLISQHCKVLKCLRHSPVITVAQVGIGDLEFYVI